MNSAFMQLNDDDDDDAFSGPGDFSSYVPTAYQPGWSWTYVIVIICLVINCTLPFLLLFAKRRDRRKSSEKEGVDTPVTTPQEGNKKGKFFASNDDTRSDDGVESVALVAAE